MQQTDTLCIRSATERDIPFLARMIREACLAPLDHCMFDDTVAEFGMDAATLMDGALRVGALAWGSVEEAFVLEEAGEPRASAFCYTPDPEELGPLYLARLPQLAAEFGWDERQAETFRSVWQSMFHPEASRALLEPPAERMIEFVAVVPEFRGRGLIKVLLQAIVAKARTDGVGSLGIRVVNGNDRARHTYESLGFAPYSAFFEEYFAEIAPGFPGLTLLRRRFERHG